jgi:hypothetical protein
MDSLELRTNIKFYQQLQESVTETLHTIKTMYGEKRTIRSMVSAVRQFR